MPLLKTKGHINILSLLYQNYVQGEKVLKAGHGRSSLSVGTEQLNETD